MVGTIAFSVDYGLLIILTEIFDIDYLISATVSFSVSLIFNYLASMRYVFARKRGLSRKREFVIFSILAILGLFINNACLYVGVDVMGFDYRLAKIVVALIVMVWNFASRKVFLDADFRKNPDIQE